MADKEFDRFSLYIFIGYFVFLFIIEFLLKDRKKVKEPTPAELLMTEKTRYYRTMNSELPKISASLQLIAKTKEISPTTPTTPTTDVKKTSADMKQPVPTPPIRKSSLDLGPAPLIDIPSKPKRTARKK